LKENKIISFQQKGLWKVGRKSPGLVVLSQLTPRYDEGIMIRLKSENRRAENSVSGNVLTKSQDYRLHPLATTELHGMSTFGDTERDALDNTGEMIRGYIQSMEANGKKIPLTPADLLELKRVVGL
jgi:predicted RNase H-like HicB family nuclease